MAGGCGRVGGVGVLVVGVEGVLVGTEEGKKC